MTAEMDVSMGEAADRLSILYIKREKIQQGEARQRIAAQIAALKHVEPALSEGSFRRLMVVNEILWEVEDAIREHEKQQVFDETFVLLARMVYLLNDRRGRLKREIDEETDSELSEVKLYTEYGPCLQPAPNNSSETSDPASPSA